MAQKLTKKKEPSYKFTIKDQAINILSDYKPTPKFKTAKQKDFFQLIDEREITICAGSAGAGKTYVAIAKALSLVKDTKTKYHKIIIIKPAIEADENIGFLPGTLDEKLAPYVQPIIEVFEKLVGKEKTELLLREGVIEIRAVAHIRGATIDNSVLVADEMQNVTPNWIKTLLTRIGEDSKFILLGDTAQSDKFKDKSKSGLADALNRFNKLDEIGIFIFTNEDVVRNPIITKILNLYE
jgi:phosphate starvation-inducible PhoH-like protein